MKLKSNHVFLVPLYSRKTKETNRCIFKKYIKLLESIEKIVVQLHIKKTHINKICRMIKIEIYVIKKSRCCW